MRSLPPRTPLASDVQKRLGAKSSVILSFADLRERREKARTIYEAARGSRWFLPVIQALRSICGEGELCMYCSANEPSQVEHYQPLSVFPEKAFEYENYLWTCDICNRHKGNRFPPDTEQGAIILNPLDDRVWDYFFLDEMYGHLIPKFDVVADAYMSRAVSTCSVIGIDRENVQIRRRHRYKRLRQSVQTTLDDFHSGDLTAAVLRTEIVDLRGEPFQADVADYFLNGLGRVHEPFLSLLRAANE